MTRQRAIFPGPLTVREAPYEGGRVRLLQGLAVPYGRLSVDLGGFRERFERGAFAPLDQEDVYAAPHHDPRQIIGRVSSSTLRLDEQHDGLHFEVELPDTTAANDLVESIRRGDITGNSFTFSIDGNDEEAVEFVDDEADGWVQVVKKARLHEVAPGVVTPAYQQTEVELVRRSFDAWREQRKLPILLVEPFDHIERLRERERELTMGADLPSSSSR